MSAEASEWTLNQSRLMARGWSRQDIKDRLGAGEKIDWKGTPMRVWTLSEVEAAEEADPKFYDTTTGREKKRILQAQEAAMAGEKQAVAMSWSSLSRKAMAIRQELARIDQIIKWSSPRYDLTKYLPPKSNDYYPELEQFGGNLGGTHYPFARDATKLFHHFSEGTRKDCMTVVAWRFDCGPKALAVLHLAGIHAPSLEGPWGLSSHIRNPETDYFAVRLPHRDAHRLYDFGDCCQLRLYD